MVETIGRTGGGQIFFGCDFLDFWPVDRWLRYQMLRSEMSTPQIGSYLIRDTRFQGEIWGRREEQQGTGAERYSGGGKALADF